MSNVLIDQLTAGTVGSTILGTDLVEIEHDPSGTPASKKSTINQLDLASNVPCCSAIRTANQAVGDGGSPAAVAFTASDGFDTDTMHDPSSNNTRVVFTTAGMYHIIGLAQFETNATNARLIFLKFNGTTTAAPIYDAGNAAGNGMAVPFLYKAAAADYVELFVYQNSGGSLNVTATLQAVRAAIG